MSDAGTIAGAVVGGVIGGSAAVIGGIVTSTRAEKAQRRRDRDVAVRRVRAELFCVRERLRKIRDAAHSKTFASMHDEVGYLGPDTDRFLQASADPLGGLKAAPSLVDDDVLASILDGIRTILFHERDSDESDQAQYLEDTANNLLKIVESRLASASE